MVGTTLGLFVWTEQRIILMGRRNRRPSIDTGAPGSVAAEESKGNSSRSVEVGHGGYRGPVLLSVTFG